MDKLKNVEQNDWYAQDQINLEEVRSGKNYEGVSRE